MKNMIKLSSQKETLHLSPNREGKEDGKGLSLLWCDVVISKLAFAFAAV